MFHRSALHTRHLVTVLGALTLIGTIATPSAFARIIRNTIDPVASVTDKGRHLIVTGPIECTHGERVYIQLTVTQRLTGAIAEGRTLLACDGEGSPQQWIVDAATHGWERFQPGPATAVASARTIRRGKTTDAHQWLVGISLVEE